MTAAPDLATAPASAHPLSGGKLPRWAPWVVALAAVALALLLAVLTGIAGVAGTTIVAALIFLVLLTAWSFSVEGRRHAADRLA
ncbi:MAG TPA: phosphate ABC transporter, permease protein PstA, partial [Dermatophilaceae bacterium]